MIVTLYQNQMPPKLTLELNGKKYVFYKSNTEYLSFNDATCTRTSESSEEAKSRRDRQKPQVQNVFQL